jgi:hypothetical protein
MRSTLIYYSADFTNRVVCIGFNRICRSAWIYWYSESKSMMQRARQQRVMSHTRDRIEEHTTSASGEEATERCGLESRAGHQSSISRKKIVVPQIKIGSPHPHWPSARIWTRMRLIHNEFLEQSSRHKHVNECRLSLSFLTFHANLQPTTVAHFATKILCFQTTIISL